MLRHDATFRHAALSLWQSALHHALTRRAGLEVAEPFPGAHAGAGTLTGAGLHLSEGHEAMRATREAAAEALASGAEAPAARRPAGAAPEEAPEAEAPPAEPDAPPPGPEVRDELRQCARLFLQLALALARGDAASISLLRSEARHLGCDPLWLEALATYEASLVRRAPAAYVRHRRLGDFVQDSLPEDARIALLADWGTGMPDAQGLLEQVRALRPDAILHLGDIYYSGTPHEVRTHFLDLFDAVFGRQRPPLYALAGNHDRYSGGEGWRLLLHALRQPASYFCLRNSHWQLLALDTGLHDADPRQAGHTLTTLEQQELAWQRDKLLHAGERRSVLLSHHPYLSLRGVGQREDGRSVAVNPHLAAGFAGLLDRVALWVWGHEHDLLLYAPYAGLQRGRCLGAGAAPRLLQRRTPLPGLVLPPGESQPPSLLPGTRLADGGQRDFHAWALLQLQGASATVHYYQASCRELRPGRTPPPGPPLYTEHLPAP